MGIASDGRWGVPCMLCCCWLLTLSLVVWKKVNLLRAVQEKWDRRGTIFRLHLPNLCATQDAVDVQKRGFAWG